jgi:Clp amino terminal domain, pathogenicity island component/UvrB/uvrC motif
VFERFTERARQVVVLAQAEASMLKHNYIGTEHLLLGLLREDEGLAARVLESFDVTVEEVRAQIVRVVGQGDKVTTGQIPFTPRAKKVLELALREAVSLGHNYIGTEHILLGIVRENEGVAARILLDFDADAEKIRNEIIGMLSGPGRRPSEDVPHPYVLDDDELERYSPKSPPIAPEVGQKLEQVRREKEEAIEAQAFAEAAALRDRERSLFAATRKLERVWFREEPEDEPPVTVHVSRGSGRMPRRIADYDPFDYRRYFLLGAAVFGVALALGLALGWLIWG